MKDSKWNTPAMQKMRDVAWGPKTQRFLYDIMHKGSSTQERNTAIDAANAKRRRRHARNLRNVNL